MYNKRFFALCALFALTSVSYGQGGKVTAVSAGTPILYENGKGNVGLFTHAQGPERQGPEYNTYPGIFPIQQVPSQEEINQINAQHIRPTNFQDKEETSTTTVSKEAQCAKDIQASKEKPKHFHVYVQVPSILAKDRYDIDTVKANKIMRGSGGLFFGCLFGAAAYGGMAALGVADKAPVKYILAGSALAGFGIGQHVTGHYFATHQVIAKENVSKTLDLRFDRETVLTDINWKPDTE